MGRSHGFNWTAEKRDRVRALRASGLMYYEIAKQLSVEWGVHLTESQCSSAASLVARKERKVDQPQAVVRDPFLSVTTGRPPEADRHETKPTIEVRAPSMYPWMEPPDAPVVHTSKSRAECDFGASAVQTASKTHSGNMLVISDPQEPYALEDVIAFLRRQRATFNIPKENAVHVGDEADFLYGSKFPVDPDNEQSAVGELRWLRERMKPWYAEFPKLRLCTSNHTDRWYKKAAGCQIPSQLVRARNEILEAPQEWVWADYWDFRDGKMPWRVEHGHNGAQNTRIRAIENGISTAHGHWHSKAGAEWARTAGGQLVWGLATGCLIDAEAIAFKYNKRDRYKPIIGCGVVLDGGRVPLFVPYDGPAA